MRPELRLENNDRLRSLRYLPRHRRDASAVCLQNIQSLHTLTCTETTNMDLCVGVSRTVRLSPTGLLNTRCQDQSTGTRNERNVDVMINKIRPQGVYCALTKSLCNAYLMDVMI